MHVPFSYSQNTASISKPNLSISYDTLMIEYDLVNCFEGYSYEIRIEANDINGNAIEPGRTHGDIGTNIACGQSKIIYWILAPGTISSNDGLFITVKGTPIQTNTQKPQISKSKYILSSIAFPGSGLSVIKKGKPFWIMGIAGYAGLATTIHFNSQAKMLKQYNEQYSDRDSYQEYEDKYQEYKKYANIAAISTGAIWAANLIWTFASLPKLKIPGLTSQNRKFYINLIYTPEVTAPVIAFKQKF